MRVRRHEGPSVVNRVRSSRVGRHVITVQPPHGLVSWRFLLPRQTRAQRIHRHLLATSMPELGRAAAGAINLWHWVRWVTFGAWRSSWKLVAARHAMVETACGVTRGRQLRSVLYFALAHGVPPRDFYQFELFRAERRRSWWTYVFTVEVTAFHRWRNGDRDQRADMQFLADKLDFASEMVAAGVPTVPTLATLPGGAGTAELRGALTDLADGPWLCKPRRGSAMQGIFCVDVRGGRVWATTLAGREIPAAEVDRFVVTRLRFGENLVQPVVRTHEAFRDLGASAQEALTLRLITERDVQAVQDVQDVQDVGIFGAWLEVPTRVGEGGGYAPVPVDVTSGVTLPDAQTTLARTAEGRAGREAICRDAAGRTVPCWREILDHATRAHARVPGLYAVAWDFIIGTDGPVLLEGNSSWGTAPPQIIYGPLLAERTTE